MPGTVTCTQVPPEHSQVPARRGKGGTHGIAHAIVELVEWIFVAHITIEDVRRVARAELLGDKLSSQQDRTAKEIAGKPAKFRGSDSTEASAKRASNGVHCETRCVRSERRKGSRCEGRTPSARGRELSLQWAISKRHQTRLRHTGLFQGSRITSALPTARITLCGGGDVGMGGGLRAAVARDVLNLGAHVVLADDSEVEQQISLVFTLCIARLAKLHDCAWLVKMRGGGPAFDERQSHAQQQMRWQLELCERSLLEHLFRGARRGVATPQRLLDERDAALLSKIALEDRRLHSLEHRRALEMSPRTDEPECELRKLRALTESRESMRELHVARDVARQRRNTRTGSAHGA
ncbi:hypothetical protein T492DRAFT_842933 [Pavlovales sp. CCMP2436]|nr:hypothetical protein T492DRAFT_842933 [Pavlovales sp. CCMP2436]